MTNLRFLLCDMGTLPCDHLCFEESGPDSAARHLPNNTLPIVLPRCRDSSGSFQPTILLSLHTTLCVRSTLFQLYLKPLAQTNKQTILVMWEVWINYFRLKNLMCGQDVDWFCLRIGVSVFIYRARRIFQGQQIWPQKTSFSQFLVAGSPG